MGSIDKEEPPASDNQIVMAKMAKGMELLAKIRVHSDDTLMYEESVRCFSEVFSMLQIKAREEAEIGSEPAADDGMSENSTVIRRRCRPGGAAERRAGAKRRRSNTYFCTQTTSSKTLEDGYTWRKYGQKEIQNAKFPRSYFRCTHKHDRGCQATRQAQRNENDPTTFSITYFGKHTCRDETDSAHPVNDDQTLIISFETPEPLPSPPSPSPSTVRPPKQECDYDIVSNWSHEDGAGSSSEYLSSLAQLEKLETMSEPGDVTSGFHATKIVGSGCLGDDFMSNTFFSEFYNVNLDVDDDFFSV